MFDANMSVNHFCSYLHLISFHVAGYHSVMWGSALPNHRQGASHCKLNTLKNGLINTFNDSLDAKQ